MVAFSFGMDRANAFRNQSFGNEHFAYDPGPDRRSTPSEFTSRSMSSNGDMEKHESLLLDATEQVRQKPGNEQDQREDYSGKKKAHTIKMLVISDRDKRIHYLSKPYCGAVHDYAMLNLEFDPDEPLWFSDHDLYVDLGFLGVTKDYETDRVKIPVKRKRRRSQKDPRVKLTEVQKAHNKAVE